MTPRHTHSKRIARIQQVMLAMNKVDRHIPVPDIKQSGDSLIRRLAMLQIGESEAKVELCDTNQSVGQLSLYRSEQCDVIRNRLNSSIREAAAQTGFEYLLEVTTIMTQSSNFYHLAIISRVE